VFRYGNDDTTLMKLQFLPGIVAIALSTLQAQVNKPLDGFNPAEVRINLSIDSISIVELPEVLDRALGRQINLIVPPDSSHIMLPPLKLHQVTIPELFEALEIASTPAGTNDPLYTFQATVGNVWVFKTLNPTPQAAASPATVSQVFPLEPYLNTLTVEDITTAIQTVAELAVGAEGRPNLKYHEETKLLIASGSPSALRPIESVLTALSTSVQSRKEKSAGVALEAARAELESQKFASNLRIEALDRENLSLRKRIEEADAKNTELERELVRARAALDLAAEKGKAASRLQ
jgi:hypothetical protein